MKKSLTIIILFLLVLTLSITSSGCSPKTESDCVKNCRGTIRYNWSYDVKTSYCEFVCDET